MMLNACLPIYQIEKVPETAFIKPKKPDFIPKYYLPFSYKKGSGSNITDTPHHVFLRRSGYTSLLWRFFNATVSEVAKPVWPDLPAEKATINLNCFIAANTLFVSDKYFDTANKLTDCMGFLLLSVGGLLDLA